MRSALLTLFCAFSFLFVNAQCSISSDSIVCKGELISFAPTPASSANSYAWTFGDGSTSSQQNPSHSYSSVGKKTVQLVITLADNSTCTATTEIMVHDLPTANFTLDNPEFCLHSQQICLIDGSSMGSTTTGYASRLILWGDGNITSSSSPANGNKICYNGYPNPGTYTIDIEIENDKGCEDRWETDITILQDYHGDLTHYVTQAGCNEQKMCISNDTFIDRSDVANFKWIFGDGAVDTLNWTGTCHIYTSPGQYKVKLEVTMKNGCVTTVEETVNINFVKVEANVSAGDSVQCYPYPFLFYNPEVKGSVMYWEIYDSLGEFITVTAYGERVAIRPLYPGDFLVRVRIVLGSCVDTSRFFNISAVGVQADFDMLNRNQCVIEDTVYAYNKSIWHPDARPTWLWRFEDSLADQSCTTSLYNCNFDSLFHSKHWYLDTGCYYPTLIAIDTVSGCIDSVKRSVVLQPIEAAEWSYGVELPCFGGEPQFAVNLGHKLCDATIDFVADSCTDVWQQFKSPVNYSTSCDSNGYITVGFAVKIGDDKVYRSADPDDYYIDESRICIDTIYKHNWFRLYESPEANFTLNRGDCLPVPVTLKYIGKDSLRLDRVLYHWHDGGGFESISLFEDTVPDLKHTYVTEGKRKIEVQVRDTVGCYSWMRVDELFGFFNNFKYDSLVCANEVVSFIDSIKYYGDTVSYWRKNNGVETIQWDFGDSTGIVTGPLPKHSWSKNGIYTVTMITTDEQGCTDTLKKKMYVGGVVAAIKQGNDEFLCDQIIQFFDSSYLVEGNASDSIVQYVWYFGDGSIESYLKNPFHYYNNNGKLTLTHAVKTEGGCTDTTTLDIYLNGPQPYFDIISDSVGCVPFTVTVKSNSTRVSNYVWHFGDSAATTISLGLDTTLSFTYTKPGLYYIYLDGLDSFYNPDTKNYYTCRATYPDSLDVNPILKRVLVLPIPQVGIQLQEPFCLGHPIPIWSTSDSKYSSFNWYIDGQDINQDDDTLFYTFNQAGSHTIALKPTYVPQGTYERACFDSSEKVIEVTDLDVRFGFQQIDNCNEYQFIDSSVNTISYNWNFDHAASGVDNFSTKTDPSHHYGLDTGTYQVCLIGRNPEGCKDTACKEVKASYYELLKMYNIISPRGDQLNDELEVDIENYDLFHLSIFNRWGEMVFQSSDPAISWNGGYLNGADLLPEGTYFYILKYSFECDNQEKEMHGTVDMVHQK